MLDPLYNAVAWVLLRLHDFWSLIFASGSGAAWGLSIILLTVLVRLALFPLFVKQIRSQRNMTQLQPKVKELQAKYKGDRETLNQELMKLYKEHNANPLSGCLPIALQLPIFLALYHVLRGIGDNLYILTYPNLAHGKTPTYYGGFTAETTRSAGDAKIFGAPIASSIHTSQEALNALAPGTSRTNVMIVGITLIVLSGAATFFTQWQMMRRTKAQGTATSQMQTTQKAMLYLLPAGLLVSNIVFPFQIGLLLYWLTTNLWTAGQQHFVIGAMDAKEQAAKAPKEAPPEQKTGQFKGRIPPPPPPGTPRPPRTEPQDGAAGAGTGAPGTGEPAAPPPRPPATRSGPSQANRRPANRKRRRT